MKKSIALTLITVFTLLLSSCIESSSIVKVNKDGSAILHVRNYTNSDAGGGLGGLGSLFGGEATEDSAAVEEPAVELPSKEELEAQAKEMGEGVTLKEVKESKNAKGWPGYEVIYEIADINTFKLSLDLDELSESGLGGDLSELSGGAEETDAGAEKEAPAEKSYVEFRFKNDGASELTVLVPEFEGEKKAGEDDLKENEEEGGASDPFGDAAGGEALGMMSMMAPMFQGARMGVFIQVDGEIKESNALHKNKNIITLMKMDMGKLFTNPENMSKMEKMNESSREEIQKLADEIDGMDVDSQEEITIKF